jgi:phosphomannomutase
MQLYLLNNNEDIYKKVINNKYKEGVDYVQFFEKLQTAKLNFSKKKTQFAETLSTGFIYDFNLNKDDFTDLSVFIGLSLNKERISERFKIGQEKIKQIFGTFYNELFIYDNKYVNSKINDISIFKNKEKLKFNKFETFIDLDKKQNIRKNLIDLLVKKAIQLEINNKVKILEGGSVGIGIYPVEYGKAQVLDFLSDYNDISYFGDKYTQDGNDYELITHTKIKGYPVDSIANTANILSNLLIN